MIIASAIGGERLAYAFAAGMVAALNPCGFALLPAYLAYYLGRTDQEDRNPGTAVLRALSVGASLTAGFLVVFGVMGVLWSSVASVLGSRLPWITAAMGVAVIALGVAMLFGFEPIVGLPKLTVGKGGQEAWSTFLFGVSYAIASLSCTIPIFAGLLSTTFTESFGAGVVIFVVFGLGMGALVTVLTVSVALAREGLVGALRGLMPYMGRISGGLLVLTGTVVAYYGWAEARQLDGVTSGTGFADRLQDAQGSMGDWVSSTIDRVGALWIGLGFGLVLGGVGLLAYRRTHQET